MGVQGVYEPQAVGPEGFPGEGANTTPTGLPPNLRVFPPVRSIGAEVFAFTRVLLVLSVVETYGRVAGEALVSGIPVVAARTPGLVECLGPSAAFVGNRADLRDLSRLIRDGYRNWDEWSDLAVTRAAWNEERSEGELCELEDRLLRVVVEQPEMIL
jgi:glycosyltransferase involved in cell wall biosynthesis